MEDPLIEGHPDLLSLRLLDRAAPMELALSELPEDLLTVLVAHVPLPVVEVVVVVAIEEEVAGRVAAVVCDDEVLRGGVVVLVDAGLLSLALGLALGEVALEVAEIFAALEEQAALAVHEPHLEGPLVGALPPNVAPLPVKPSVSPLALIRCPIRAGHHPVPVRLSFDSLTLVKAAGLVLKGLHLLRNFCSHS